MPLRQTLLLLLLISVGITHGEQCPDVAHCFDVCGDKPHHNSQCTSSSGHGEYTAECCEGTGRVCPQPPCSGKSKQTPAPAESPARAPSSKPMIPPLRLRPSHATKPSPEKSEEEPWNPFEQLGKSSRGPGMDLASFLHSLPLLPAHPGGMSPFHPALFNQAMPRQPQPGEGDCSQILIVQLKEGKRSSGLRDDIAFGHINCYRVKVPEQTRTLKLGLRTLSPPGHDIPDVHAAMGTWPKGRKVEIPHWKSDDDDVSYATFDVAGRGDMYLKLSGHMGPSLDYQIWFVQVSEDVPEVEEDVWYGFMERLFVSPASRVAIGMYLAMGAGVGLSLSQPAVQVQPKTLAKAYLFWVMFGILGGHRFYLNRTASAIIWYFTVVGLVLGLTIDLSVRSGWSNYLHHHALWGALLALTTGGLIIDGFLIPVMAKESTYWERSYRKRKQKGRRRRRSSDDSDDGADGDIEEGSAQLRTLKNEVQEDGTFNIQADIPERPEVNSEVVDIRERHRNAAESSIPSAQAQAAEGPEK